MTTILTRSDYETLLTQKGYRAIAGGYFCSVYAKPRDKSHVVKITRQGDGWIAYARYVVKNGKITPNKHYPRIFDFADHGTWACATMERLDSLDDHPDLHATYDALKSWCHHGKTDAKLPKSLRSFARRLRFALTGKWQLDMHGHNAMVRVENGVKTLVVTDPLSFPC